MSRIRQATFACALMAAASGAAAHTGERGFVMLLPTGLYIAGGALAVVLSFAVMALLPSKMLLRFTAVDAPVEKRAAPRWPGALSLAVVLVLVAAGWFGSRDPLANPLPGSVWTLWWVGFTFLVAVRGDLWRRVNPWKWLAAPFSIKGFPGRAGHWPALALFFAFAWFELIHPAPQDPEILAWAVFWYLLLTAAAKLLFGEEWMAKGEAFSVFFAMVARLAPPWRGLLSGNVLPASLVAFVLLALASVSFDGLSRTFWWLGLIGENPLEHPGRSGVLGPNSAGLVGTFAAFVALYGLAVKAGAALAREKDPAYGYYIVAIVPIAFGYHFAHYLPTFLVDSQHAVKALSDPFGLGWNLLGTRDLHVRASFLSHHSSVQAIWYVQVAGIVAAHAGAVCVAHVLALRRLATPRAALLSQLPMTALMVGYTVLGLWLLSTPVAG